MLNPWVFLYKRKKVKGEKKRLKDEILTPLKAEGERARWGEGEKKKKERRIRMTPVASDEIKFQLGNE